jgi:hypothetical protein
MDVPASAPAVAVYGKQIWLVFRNTNAQLCYTTFNGSTWMQTTPFPSVSSYGAASLCVFDDMLYIFYSANDESVEISRVVVNSAAGTIDDLGPLPGGFASFSRTASCVFGKKLYLFWLNDLSGAISFASSSDGTAWLGGDFINTVDASPSAPAACEFNGQLLLAFAGAGGNLRWTSSANGLQWPVSRPLTAAVNQDASSEAPAALVFGKSPYVLWSRQPQIYYARGETAGGSAIVSS